jgi:hypothetical protein
MRDPAQALAWAQTAHQHAWANRSHAESMLMGLQLPMVRTAAAELRSCMRMVLKRWLPFAKIELAHNGHELLRASSHMGPHCNKSKMLINTHGPMKGMWNQCRCYCNGTKLAKELPADSLEWAQYMRRKNADIRPALTHQIYQVEVILFTIAQ